jgi:hypothetical protein
MNMNKPNLSKLLMGQDKAILYNVLTILTVQATTEYRQFQTVIVKSIRKIPPGFLTIFVAVVITSVIVIVHLSNHHLTTLEIVTVELSAFFATVVVELLVRWQELNEKHKKIEHYADKLVILSENVPAQLHEYVQMSINRSIDSMQGLSIGESIECSYSEQIAIADNLAKGAQTRLWATSIDKPSKLWEEGIAYFNTLASLNITVTKKENFPPEKARVVMLDLDALLEDYRNNWERFNDFAEWHDKNGYLLRFYLVKQTEDLSDEIQRTIVNDSDPLKDFMIKDGEFVYGRTQSLPGNRVKLKFIPHQEGKNIDTFNSYGRLFQNLWARSFPIKTMIDQLEYEKNSQARERQVRRDYESEFVEATLGRKFFEALLIRIRNAKKSLLAVDVADMKDGISHWSFQEEYRQWLEACIIAAKGGVDAKRVFVVRNLQRLKNYDVVEVLRSQLEANFEIVIVNEQDVIDTGLDKDFLLIDDSLGFRLDDKEPFSKDTLEIGKNLISKAEIAKYMHAFNRLYQDTSAKKFKGKDGVGALEAFLKE